MKNLVSFLLILGVLMSSCQGPRHNFNRQKFTKLKHLKSQNEQQEETQGLIHSCDYESFAENTVEESPGVSGDLTSLNEENRGVHLDQSQDGLDVTSNTKTTASFIKKEINKIQRDHHERNGLDIEPASLSLVLIILGFLAVIGIAIIAIPTSTSIPVALGVIVLLLMVIALTSFIGAFISKRKDRKNKAEERGDRDGVDDENYQKARNYFNLTMFSRSLVTLCFIMALSLELFFSFELIIVGAIILGLAVLAGLIFNVWSNMNAAISMAKHLKSGAKLTGKAKAIRFFLWLELVYVGLPMLFIPLIITLIKVSKIKRAAE